MFGGKRLQINQFPEDKRTRITALTGIMLCQSDQWLRRIAFIVLIKRKRMKDVNVMNHGTIQKKPSKLRAFTIAVRTRLELATPCVTGMYSNQLNYRTKYFCCFCN